MNQHEERRFDEAMTFLRHALESVQLAHQVLLVDGSAAAVAAGDAASAVRTALATMIADHFNKRQLATEQIARGLVREVPQ